jgi:hypothetical protein
MNFQIKNLNKYDLSVLKRLKEASPSSLDEKTIEKIFENDPTPKSSKEVAMQFVADGLTVENLKTIEITK